MDQESNSYNATVMFTHGSIAITGTFIFVLARIAEAEKKEGFVYTDRGERLVKGLEEAAERRAANEAVYYKDGAGEDMGIFAGMGDGFYFNWDGEEHGPYDSKANAAIGYIAMQQAAGNTTVSDKTDA